LLVYARTSPEAAWGTIADIVDSARTCFIVGACYDVVGDFMVARMVDIGEMDVATVAAIALGLAIMFIGGKLTLKYWVISGRYADAATGDDGDDAARKKRFSLWAIYRFVVANSEGLIDAAYRFIWLASVRREMVPALCDTPAAYIHCHDLITLPAGHAATRFHRARLVFDSHEIYEELGTNSFVARKLYGRLQRRNSRGIDAFITINDSIGDFLRNKYPNLPAPIIVKNAVRYQVGAIAYDGRLHDAAGLDRNERILLYQGGFGPRRGLETLVRSAAGLKEGWYLVMMGWGNIEERLKRLVQSAADGDSKVRFVPAAPQSELRLWTTGATVGIIPYENVNLNHWFCTPNKLWEYPAAGVPIVASPFPEMRKVIETWGIGWLLPLRMTPDSMADTINRLADHDIARKKAACLEYIRQDNWSIYEDRLVGVYQRLCTEENLSHPAM
jgi:glycosyltransferase involved in cell wall biosynthesis